MASIPAQFDLKIAFGFQAREFIKNYEFPPDTTAKDRELIPYSDTVARFCQMVEKFMREHCNEEVTIIIAEDNQIVRSRLKKAHAQYRDPIRMKKINPKFSYFPFQRIRDTIHFAKKNESAHLQIADICTFIIKRRLMEDEHIRPYYAAIKPQMLELPKGENRDEISW